MQTTHVHTQIHRYTHKLGHTNAYWHLDLATGGEERGKTGVDNNEREKGGKRERDEEKKQRDERNREVIG